jgi:hypothetical protein
MSKFSKGDKVVIRCSAYHNGRKTYGTFNRYKNETTAYIQIEGNTKSTQFAVIWLSQD